jgi:hypothetical protein
MIPTLALSLVLFGLPQDSKTGLTTRPKAAPVRASGYVSEAEARTVFTRSEGLIRKVTGSRAIVPPMAIGSSSNPASRKALLMEFVRLYAIAEPKFKLMPPGIAMNLSVIKMSDPTAKTKLVMLVKRGAVANYGSLAAGPNDRLTLQEFGDALGFFLARIAQMTHMPSTRYTPELMGGS